MINIYVGDGGKIMNRIRNQHCSGNVEGSSLRKTVAKAMGYDLIRTQREKESSRIRLDMPDYSVGEKKITNYLRSGEWKFVICPPGVDAKDFQFYVIQNIQPAPILNINQGSWNINNVNIYRELLNQLENCQSFKYNDLKNVPNKSGVYLFIHDYEPTI